MFDKTSHPGCATGRLLSAPNHGVDPRDEGGGGVGGGLELRRSVFLQFISFVLYPTLLWDGETSLEAGNIDINRRQTSRSKLVFTMLLLWILL